MSVVHFYFDEGSSKMVEGQQEYLRRAMVRKRWRAEVTRICSGPLYIPLLPPIQGRDKREMQNIVM